MKCVICKQTISSAYMSNKLGVQHVWCRPDDFSREFSLKPPEVWQPSGQIARKNDQDKVDLSLIPYSALIAEAKAMMVGAKKYGRSNYKKGHEASQLVAAALRHLHAWNAGEELDAEDGQPHLGSVRACIGMLIEQQKLGTLKDNRKA